MNRSATPGAQSAITSICTTRNDLIPVWKTARRMRHTSRRCLRSNWQHDCPGVPLKNLRRLSERARPPLNALNYPLGVILLRVRWYVAYSLSLRNLEEMIAERGFEVDHSTVHRWVITLVPLFEKTFRRHKRAVGRNWRMDETYIKVKGDWKYLYRAVDKARPSTFCREPTGTRFAARRYFEKAIGRNGAPETVTVDRSGANPAALQAIHAERKTPIKVWQNKYLNNVVEQDHRAIKRIVKPMMGFKNFRCARIVRSGIELMHRIRKGQMKVAKGTSPFAAEQFHS